MITPKSVSFLSLILTLAFSLQTVFSCFLACLVIFVSGTKSALDVSGKRNWGTQAFVLISRSWAPRPLIRCSYRCQRLYFPPVSTCVCVCVCVLFVFCFPVVFGFLQNFFLGRVCLAALWVVIHYFYTGALMMWWEGVGEGKHSVISWLGTALVVQLVRLRAPDAGSPGSVPGRRTRSRMHAATKSSHAAPERSCVLQLKNYPACCSEDPACCNEDLAQPK